ncbi:MAG: hypothetical protein KAJ19_23280, partial [Gammaproteobacteria bacterium]|nr:hypothetical protein [Gammaproteobacteria bacterium]
IYDSTGKGDVSLMLINDVPNLQDEVVDISLGGTKDADYLRSLHIPYDGIYKIASHQFGDMVRKVSF